MIKYFVLIITLCALMSSAYAQQWNVKNSDTLIPYTTVIRFNPMALIDPSHPNFTIGLEKRLTKKSSIALDFSTMLPLEVDSRKIGGFIVRPSYKYFIPALNNIISDFFIEADVFWKSVSFTQTEWLRYNFNQPNQYQEFKKFTLKKNVLGSHFKIGTRSTIANKVLIEAFIGGGLRVIQANIPNEPNAHYDYGSMFLGERLLGNHITTISTSGGVRLLFLLN